VNQPTSSTQSTEIPEEAEEKAAQALYEEWMFEVEDENGDSEEAEGVWSAEGDGIKSAFRKQARAALEAAAQALRKQGAEEERERLKLDPRKLRALGLELPASIFDDAIAPILAALADNQEAS
jgi:hypothetical protein